jgi:Uncharacterized alpha/beta hydrolase domain (DUF2235)
MASRVRYGRLETRLGEFRMAPKRLVICFDGTWNSADSAKTETNVALLARTVEAASKDGTVQLTTYLRGVGSSGLVVERLAEGAFGEGIDENIRSGYMFLAQNYMPGDSIYIFGFSRGAFTARSLVGFVGACGLIKRPFLGHLHEAWNYYRKADPRTPAGFCAACGADNHQDVSIAFLGVWDTVGSLGIPGTLLNGLTAGKYQFHDTSPSRIVKVARHALAIDEHRDEFEPTLWTGTEPPGSDIKQVWFAGAHSDVGGGYQDRRLAEIPLRWMAEEAVKAGLQLDLPLLTKVADLDPLAPQHESRMSWSRKDRITPTIRQIDGAVPEVSFYERLYRPVDSNGHELPAINESLHESVVKRFNKEIVSLNGDDDTAGEKLQYAPKNLAAAIKKHLPQEH